MKIISKIIIVLIITAFIIKPAFAISPTPSEGDTKTTKASPTPTPATKEDTEIEKIKDLVASKVAELKLVDKQGLLGTVKTATNSQIVLKDSETGNEDMIDVDELTKFNSDTKDSFGISDIKAGDVLSIIGLYNKDNQRLLARFVSYASNVPIYLEGASVAKDTDNFTLTIVTADGKKTVVNVESSTKTSSFEDGETVKSGFSKISTGERIIAVGFFDKTEKDQLNALRIVRLPNVSLSEEMKKAVANYVSSTPTASPKEK